MGHLRDVGSYIREGGRKAREMRLLRLAATVAACMAAGLGATATASADPSNNPKAMSVNFVCGGVPVTLLILNTHNGTAAAFTSSTSVGIAAAPQGAVQTTTCTATINGQQVSVTAFFTPPAT